MSRIRRRTTKRLNLEAYSNPASKKAGANRVTLSLAPSEGEAWRGNQSMSFTHREARAIFNFLNEALG
jgi:hypothetical protein